MHHDPSPEPAGPPRLRQRDYERLFEANPSPMWVFDLETLGFLDVNLAACEEYGYSREEFLSMSLRDLRPAEDQPVPEQVQPTPLQSFQPGIRRHRLKDGRLIDVEITSHEVVYQGRRARLVCSLDVTERLRAEQALQEREAGLRRAQSMARLAHVVTRPDGSFESWSDSLPELFGLAPEDMPRDMRGWVPLLHPDDVATVRARGREATALGQRADLEYRIRHAKGHWVSIAQVSELLDPRTPAGSQRWFSTLQDVTEQRRIQDRMTRLNRVHAALSGINNLIVRVRDRDELFREACRIAVGAGAFRTAWIGMVDPATGDGTRVASFGGTPQHVRDVPLSLREDSPYANRPSSRALRSRQPVVVNDMRLDPHLAPVLERLLADGHLSVACLPLLVGGQAVGVLGLSSSETGVFDDETVRMLQDLAGDIAFALDHLVKEDRLHHLAYYDAVTGLANSRLLQERLAQHVAGATPQHEVALALIDIERFKSINDSLGRHVGDRLLAQLAQRLTESTGDPSSLARLGADHFALVMTGVRASADAARMVDEHYRHCFEQPFQVDGHELHLSAKVGIAIAPHDGCDGETVFRHAEVAVRRAKSGGNRALFFDAGMASAVAEKLLLENRLRRALDQDQFVLHYQPKVALATGCIVGLEALIRWNAPGLGLVPPMKFIPLLEETGLIVEVGRWALEQASRDRQRWEASGMTAPRVAVNVSAVQLRKPDFVDTVRQALGNGPSGIDIELTESLVMEDVHSTIAKLNALRELGVNLAIDDFGTGYSSLAYLARLPVQTLKIDRGFVRTMLEESTTMMLVSTMVSMAHSLKLQIVAEGVETPAQAQALRELACDQIQGYLISRPVPMEEVAGLLAGGEGLAAI